MRRNFVAIASVGAAVLLAACESDHLNPTSTNIVAPRHSASANRSLPPCDASFRTAIPALGLNYFSPNDPVIATIIQFSGATDDARPAIGFDILKAVSTARYSGKTAAGGALVDAIVACMNLGLIPDAFDPVAAISNGIFEVRGGNTTDGPALGAMATASGAPAIKHDTAYGVEPKTASNWPSAQSPSSGAPRYLIYGYRTTGDFAGETPKDGFNAFEVGSLPANLDKTGLRVGVCDKLVTDRGAAVNVLIHNDTMVANQSPNFCNPPAPPTASLARSWVTRVASVFRPSIAFAQDDGGFSRDFIGGGPSSWSPMSWGKVKGSDMNLAFARQPTNTNKSVAIPQFVVHVQTDAGNGVPGVVVTVSVDKNNGLPAGAVVSGTVSVATNGNGDAIFKNVFVDKAGGYHLGASGSLGGVTTLSTTSTLFNVKNK